MLVRENWLDHDYIERHTLGFEALAARAAQYSPEKVAAICGIAASEVEALAHDYWHLRPAAIRLNYGMQRAHGGGNAVRAVTCLPALAGHWRSPAGGVLLSTSGMFNKNMAALQRADLVRAAYFIRHVTSLENIDAYFARKDGDAIVFEAVPTE